MVVDMHCDTISRILENGEGLRQNTGHLDLVRMKQSDYLLQNFALFVSLGDTKEPFSKVCAMLEIFKQEMVKNSDWIRQITSYAELVQNQKAGRMSALLTVEEGGVCLGELSRLQYLFDKGVRMVTISWNYPNGLSYPNVNLQKSGKPDFMTPDMTHGLTEKGIQFVEKMEELGMIPDVSHLSDAGFWDVLSHTKKPFAASHSNAREICPNVRNLTDEMIQALAERGGVMGLNFCEDFLTTVSEKERTEENVLEALVAHASHIVKVGGSECLGLGSDFDGIVGNRALPDVCGMERLEQALRRAGFTATLIDKVMYQNVMRLYREVL